MINVSVVVPVYNVESLVGRCLESLVSQTFENFEIIVVNDGSTDKSMSIVDKFHVNYPSLIKLVNQENKGLSEARNVGTRLAQGKYIYYIDSDDYIKPDTLETMVNLAEENKLDYVIDGFTTVTEDGDSIANYSVEFNKKNEVINPATEKQLFLIHNAVWNRLYLTKIIRENNIGFLPGVWYEDLLFSREYLVHSKRAMVIDNLSYQYVQREGSVMSSIASKKNYDVVIVFKALTDYYRQQNKLDVFKDEIEYLAILHFYIAASVRLIRGSNYTLLNQVINEFENQFPTYKNNTYMSIMPRNSKVVYRLLNLKLYKIIYRMFRFKSGE